MAPMKFMASDRINLNKESVFIHYLSCLEPADIDF